jgi:hypothetical protein
VAHLDYHAAKKDTIMWHGKFLQLLVVARAAKNHTTVHNELKQLTRVEAQKTQAQNVKQHMM